MLLRLAYLAVTNAVAALRLLPMGDRDKDVEILALRHQITVLERQLGAKTRVRFAPEDRAFLAALLTSPPREVLRRLRLVVRPDTVLRWHRDLMKRRHARTCRPNRRGRPPTVRSIRVLILRLVRENPWWGYRRVHGELTTLGIKIAPSTIWEILKQEGLDPTPERASTTWAAFLRSQADGLLACDFIETITLNGQRQYILAITEHATRQLDRCLICNERHLRHALREYEEFYNQHRAHQAPAQAAPLRTAPDPITDPERIIDLNIRRRDRLGGVLHQYSHAA